MFSVYFYKSVLLVINARHSNVRVRDRVPYKQYYNQAHTCKTLGVVASMKYELTCMSCEATRFLALEPVSFSTTAAYSFVFAV